MQQQNPLGKIPVLQLEDSNWLYDSPVILEYLDSLAGGGRIVPKDAKARFEALRLEALADGILDASILQVYEGRYRPPEKHESRSGSTCKPARSRAGWRRWKPHCRSSRRRPRSARSRSPARSAIATSALPAAGARTIRAWSAGSMLLPRACPPSPPPRRRRRDAAKQAQLISAVFVMPG